MRALQIRSDSKMLYAFLVILLVCGSVHAAEIHIVGDAAHKYVDGEWVLTSPQPLGDMRAAWAFAEDDVYAGDADGSVYHFDGSKWDVVYHDPYRRKIEDVWGTSSTNIYVCFNGGSSSGNGELIHFDGGVWSDVDMPDDCDYYASVYGFSENDIYVVADDYYSTNLIYHYDGVGTTPWKRVSIQSLHVEMNCTAVWGSSGSDVFISGNDGEIIHWDGENWELTDSGVTERIYDLWGAASNDVFAVLNSGIIHYDGGAWTAMSIPGSNYLRWIAGISSSEVLVGGWLDKVLHYDGGTWSERTGYEYASSNDACMLMADHALLFDSDGKLYSYDGSTIERIDQLFYWMKPLNAVCGTASDNVYAVGEDGYAYRYDGVSWSEIARPCDDRLVDVFALSETEIYALDDVSRVYHYDGISWVPIMGGMDSLEPCNGICGTSSSNLYAAGGDKIYRWDGVSWQIEYQNSCPDPNCDWTDLRDIWVSSSGDIFAVGSCTVEWSDIHGTFYSKIPLIFHYDGFEWTYTILKWCSDQCPGEYFEAVYGTSDEDVIAVGPTAMFYYDGDSWNEIVNGDPGVDAWIALDGSAYVVYGTSLRYAADVYSFWYGEYFPGQAEFRGIWGIDDVVSADTTPQPGFELTQNHPNPFNPSTTISFSLRERGRASLAVYDVAGRLVRVLLDEVKEAGPHDVTWDGRNRDGSAVASGVYFYRLEAGEYTETRKMVLLR